MLKLKKTGGMRVGRGNYWNLTNGNRIHLEAAGVLPGDETVSYYPIHPVVLLMIAPVLGLLYAIFLPFIGIAMLVTLTAKKLFTVVTEEVKKVAVFSWSPSEAYLAGRKGKAKKKAEKKKNA